MKTVLSALQVVCFLYSFFPIQSAWACKVRSDIKVPTLEENFKKASSVILAIEKKQEAFKAEDNGRAVEKYKMTFEIKKTWKGRGEKETVLTAGPNSSCDPFAQFSPPGYACVIFVDENNQIISGVLAGEASFCVPGDSPRAKNLEAEYTQKFKALK